MTTTSIDVANLIGLLNVEADQRETEGVDSPTATYYRPDGIGLDNEGFWAFWMTGGETYDVVNDGEGWRVTSVTWPADAHVYHLATAHHDFVNVLPGADGPIQLEVGRQYVITQTEGVWALLAA